MTNLYDMEAFLFDGRLYVLAVDAKRMQDRVEQLEREKAAWLEAYGGAVLELTERNKEMEAALREVCSIPAQKRGSASHAMLVIAAAALGEKKDG